MNKIKAQQVVGRGSVSEYPLMWGAAISAFTWVSRGHINEMRLAADHTGKMLQSSTQIDKAHWPLAHNQSPSHSIMGLYLIVIQFNSVVWLI